MTGAELRAWRERLGKDEAWIEDVLGAMDVALGADAAYGRNRREHSEAKESGYQPETTAAFRAAYRAALEAEERAQAARGPVEPVCPEGVTRGDMLDPDDGSPNMMGDLGLGWQVHVSDSGHIRLVDSGSASPALMEYAAALSRYRAATHAASDRQRKLDAVRAAEEAHNAAHKAAEDAHARYRDAEEACGQTHKALKAARREAGL